MPQGFHVRRAIKFVVVACLGLSGCSSASSGDASNRSHEHAAAAGLTGRGTYSGAYPMRITCTTGMVGDLVQHVGGPYVEVVSLMGANSDPHLYKATTGDVNKLNRADMIFYSGLHLEGKMGEIFARLARKKPTVAVTGAIPEDRLLEVSTGLFDPHVWFDVSLWSEALAAVAEALSQYDPAHAAEYKENARKYRVELDKLHQDCREQVATIRAQRRVLVTAHDAFHYFGRAYDMEVKAIQGISTEAEAGVKEINELVAFISDRGIKAVFVETSVSERNILAVVEGCQARGHQVVIGGKLHSDAMGRPGTPEGTYVGMVRSNVDTIVKALK